MIKKILLIICLFLLSSCSVNKKDLYKLTINDEDIYVGYSISDDINTSFDEIKTDDEGVITSITLYIKDYDYPIYINNIEVDSSININLQMFKGYMSKGACVVNKNVSKKVNRIIFYNNILNDDSDELDHITISFE